MILSKIHILADSSCDLTLEEAKQYDIRILPFSLNFENGEEYADRYDITPEEFYRKIRTITDIPKTVQITPAKFEEYFREEASLGYEEIVVIVIASTASGTYQSAVIAKGVVEDEGLIKVHLVDSLNLAFGTGNAVIQGAKALKQGKSAEEVAEIITDTVRSTKSYFVVETLDYLRKGGRIKTATAVIGGVLDIRPILHVTNGCVESFDKVRGEKKVIPKLISIFKEEVENPENSTVMILHGDAEEKANALALQLEEETGKKADIIHDVGAIIGAHSGPGVLGLVFTAKN